MNTLAAPHPRGQPLLVLAGILGGWVALRVLLWEPPFASPVLATALGRGWHAQALAAARREAGTAPVNPPAAARALVPGPGDPPNSKPLPSPWRATTGMSVGPPPMAAEPDPAAQVVGHQLLLAAAFGGMELPAAITPYLSVARSPASPPPASPSPAGAQPLLGRATDRAMTGNRWSGDAWSLVRTEGMGPLAVGVPSYGRSQAGAVLRYRLVPDSGHRPIAYARVTRSLAEPRETEVAAGLAARPLARIPISVAAEVRVYQGPAGREMRPAAFAVTELPPAALPLGVRAEAYAQAGYVGGRFATAFVDGQARLDRQVVPLGGDAELRAGGGVWGGAQKGAGRLDVGPSASVGFLLGEVRSRLEVDYRIRIAGDAAPKSGPALTISAGF